MLKLIDSCALFKQGKTTHCESQDSQNVRLLDYMYFAKKPEKKKTMVLQLKWKPKLLQLWFQNIKRADRFLSNSGGKKFLVTFEGDDEKCPKFL